MNKLALILTSVALVWSAFLLYTVKTSEAQLPNSTIAIPPQTIPVSGNAVTVSSSITLQVANATLKTNQATLKNAVLDFFDFGPNILKISDSIKLIVKIKISNQIDNVTQTVEGKEATNAIVEVEIGNALNHLISSANKGGIINVGTSSTCKLAVAKSISCDNTVSIK